MLKMNPVKITELSPFARYVVIRGISMLAILEGQNADKIVTCKTKDVALISGEKLKEFVDYIFIEGEPCLITDFHPMGDDLIKIRVVEGLTGK